MLNADNCQRDAIGLRYQCAPWQKEISNCPSQGSRKSAIVNFLPYSASRKNNVMVRQFGKGYNGRHLVYDGEQLKRNIFGIPAVAKICIYKKLYTTEGVIQYVYLYGVVTADDSTELHVARCIKSTRL